MNPQVMLIMAGCVGIWWVGHKTVEGVKKLDHTIVNKFHHTKITPKVNAIPK